MFINYSFYILKQACIYHTVHIYVFLVASIFPYTLVHIKIVKWFTYYRKSFLQSSLLVLSALPVITTAEKVFSAGWHTLHS